ncbi:MAG: PKD domain-containing protein [Saprospiraceae bacterium]|nr:PKD domain-containing protein [Saprospiraceae bacterium]
MKSIHFSRLAMIGFLTLISIWSGYSRHIIGSDFYYECEGAGRAPNTKTLKFHLDVYRDCSTPILFNPNAAFGIYTFSNARGYRFIDQFTVSHGNISNVKADQNPCIIIPPNVCVETTDYEFRIDLPVINETYVIFYIQCCRNRTILNIPNPGNTGATFFIEISPEAQTSCNNSPRFKSFPPIVICADFALNFDHSATDKDGDSLAYEFCPLLAGGGPGGGVGGFPGNGGACQSPTPDPRSCPPPFTFLSSVAGFSFIEPLGRGVLQLNDTSGLLTGRPMELGQYVVGICVKEYRNGKQIGAIHRDFQFNVTICEQAVHAKIKADSSNGKEFFINYCGDDEVSLFNESFNTEYINNYYWEFKPKNNPGSIKPLISQDRDAKIIFTQPGQYTGVMIVNRNAIVCNDTAYLNLNIIPSDIKADFEFDYDKCSTAPIKFMDKSAGKITPVKTYSWDFADTKSAAVKNPVHLFEKPGLFNVKLTVTDGKLCKSEKIKPLSYFPSPALLDILPDKFRACVPATIIFQNLSIPLDSTYDISWEFGDGSTSKVIHPTHTYKEPGLYSIKLSLKAPSGCVTTETFPNFIRVQDGPIADFKYTPDDPTTKNSSVSFTNESRFGIQYNWDFGDDAGSVLKDPVHTYRDTGDYIVTLTTKHENGCTDSTSQYLRVGLFISYFLPNAFTPNNDGINDLYFGKGALTGMQDFQFSIYNRWGELIYHTKDPSEGWNGKKANIGPLEPNGVYVCVVKYKNDHGVPKELKGFATLIR